MSKQQKSKITLELPKKNLVNSSVFQRLGHKKEKIPKASSLSSSSQALVIPEKKALEVCVDHQITDSVSAKLQLVRQKAAQIMDSKKKQEVVLAERPPLTIMRPIRRSSSSDSSSSSSASSSSSSSPRRKVAKKRSGRKRMPSSSSEERKVVKKHSHRKSEKKAHKKARELTKNLVKRAISPSYSRGRRESESPPKKLVKKKDKEREKLYRHGSREAMREVERDREIYEREKAKARERERVRSPSPKLRRSRSPRAAVYHARERSDDRSPYRRVEQRERERKEREYEMARERERAEALARCQERQRERERIKKLEMEMEARRRPRSVERRHRSRSRSFSRERIPIVREREEVQRYRTYEEHRRSPFRREEASPYESRRPHYEEEPREVHKYREEPVPYHKHERYEGVPRYEDERYESQSSSSKEIYQSKYRREYPESKEWTKEPPPTEHYKYTEKHWETERPSPVVKRDWPPTYRSPRPSLRHERAETYRPRIPGYRPSFRPRAPGGFNPRFSSSYFPRTPRVPYQPRQPIMTTPAPAPAPVVMPVEVAPKQAPKQEKDEDNLSEISDEADDILEKPEGVFSRQIRARQRQVTTETKLPVEETVPVDDTKSHANKTLKEEMQLDFEEISDGELDEENKIKSLGDALGVDWGSIVEESKKKVKDESQTSNAREKWQPHRILLDVGVSTLMAGEEFAAHVIRDCYDKFKQEVTAQALTAKAFDGKKIKGEPTDDEDIKPDIEAKVKESLTFTDAELIEKRYAFAQNGYKERLEQRKNLIFNSIGSCSRALSARQDLKIRRRLCGLPDDELLREIPITEDVEDGTLKQQPALSSLELAFQMFKKATEKVC